MWCISLAPDAWNLSGQCQATQDAKDTADATQDAQSAGDAKDATQDAQDTQDGDSTLHASGRNGTVSDAG